MHPPYDCANLATFVWLQRVEDEEIASDTRDMGYVVQGMGYESRAISEPSSQCQKTFTAKSSRLGIFYFNLSE